MNQKQDIILKHTREGESWIKAIKETGLCREIIRQYVKDYENMPIAVNSVLGEIGKIYIIYDITTKPKYISSPKNKKTLTDEVIEDWNNF